jgi:DNA-binding GntR family transcriptional regulator
VATTNGSRTDSKSGSAEAPVRKGGGRASQRAYDYLRSGIIDGNIKTGTVLAEGDVAERLQISRTPVRQALRLLLQEDLVEVGSRRQIVVRGVSPERRREVFLIRDSLERIAVHEAAERMAIEEIDQLRLLLIRQRRAADAPDAKAFVGLDEEFHQRIAMGGELTVLVKFLAQLRAFTRLMGLHAIAIEGRMDIVLQEHEAIVDALEARDAPKSVEAIVDHLRTTQHALELAESRDAEQKKAPAKKASRSRARRSSTGE